MSGKVWMSSLFSNSNVGYKLGLRRKPFGSGWDPEGHAPPPVGEMVAKSIMRYTRGEALLREEMPEAAAVWDEKSFRRAKDIFAVGGVYCVKGVLGEVLANSDLGDGELIPFPIYKADLKTPYPEESFLLNFGCRKNTLLPEMCGDAQKFLVRKDTGQQVWHINKFYPDSDVALSSSALEGPDLWFEEAVHNKIFLSDVLAKAIVDVGMNDVFELLECKVIGDVQ